MVEKMFENKKECIECLKNMKSFLNDEYNMYQGHMSGRFEDKRKINNKIDSIIIDLENL